MSQPKRVYQYRSDIELIDLKNDFSRQISQHRTDADQCWANNVADDAMRHEESIASVNDRIQAIYDEFSRRADERKIQQQAAVATVVGEELGQALTAWIKRIATDPEGMAAHQIKLSWSAEGNDFVGLFTSGVGLSTFVQVDNKTPGSSDIDGQKYLPSNDRAQFETAVKVASDS